MILRLILIATLFAVSACSLPFQKDAGQKVFYIIAEDTDGERKELKKRNIGLLVGDTRANRFINSSKIIFSEDASSRGHYQLAAWVEPPPKRFAHLLLKRLDTYGPTTAVARLSSAAIGELQLNTEIIEFYHNTSKSPGTVEVEVSAEVIDLNSRSIMARKEFKQSVAVEWFNSEGAIKGFSHAVNRIIDEIIVWLDSVIPADGVSSSDSQ